jgi:hypothetical protein
MRCHRGHFLRLLRFLRRASAWNQDQTALRTLTETTPTSFYKKQLAASLLLSALPLAPTKDFSASSYSSLCVLERRNPRDSEVPTVFVKITSLAHSTSKTSRDRWPTTSHGEGLEFWGVTLTCSSNVVSRWRGAQRAQDSGRLDAPRNPHRSPVRSSAISPACAA